MSPQNDKNCFKIESTRFGGSELVLKRLKLCLLLLQYIDQSSSTPFWAHRSAPKEKQWTLRGAIFTHYLYISYNFSSDRLDPWSRVDSAERHAWHEYKPLLNAVDFSTPGVLFYCNEFDSKKNLE